MGTCLLIKRGGGVKLNPSKYWSTTWSNTNPGKANTFTNIPKGLYISIGVVCNSDSSNEDAYYGGGGNISNTLGIEYSGSDIWRYIKVISETNHFTITAKVSSRNTAGCIFLIQLA